MNRGSVQATIGWIVAGLLGLVFAALLASSAARLVTEPVGLSAEPLAAGNALVAKPAVATPTKSTSDKIKKTAKKPAHKKPRQVTNQPPPRTVIVVPIPAGDGHGGDENGGDSDSDDD